MSEKNESVNEVDCPGIGKVGFATTLR